MKKLFLKTMAYSLGALIISSIVLDAIVRYYFPEGK